MPLADVGVNRILLTIGLTVAVLLVVPAPANALLADSHSTDGESLSLFSAIVLGLVEGLTEYLPVSSTGHLLITNRVLGIGETPESERALDTYAICIQAGAIVAVFFLYRERIRQMFDGLLGRSESGRRVLLAVIAAFIPTAIIGLALVDRVRDNLFGEVEPIAAAWIVGGIAILVASRLGFWNSGNDDLSDITLRQAVMIGVAQSIAIWPGVSRSLVTIMAAIAVGLTLPAAVEFAFLLGLITLSAATLETARTDGAELIELFGWVSPAVGLVVAFLAAVVSIKWMVSWLNNRGFDIFGYYRIVIGLVAFAAIAGGWL